MAAAEIPIEQVSKVVNNKYQAIIIASQRARHLNSQRLMQLAMLEQATGPVEIDGRKITMVALKDLVDGRIKFELPESN